jgi:hypothetical protein
MRVCRHCGHTRASHIATYVDDSNTEVDDWDCVVDKCDCHYFQEVPTTQPSILNRNKPVLLSHSERTILIHLIRINNMEDDLLDLIEKLKG